MKKSVLVLAFLAGIVSLNSDARDSKNGFDVANASIPVGEILSGGPAKDGIPAIDTPRFVGAQEAGFLSDDDRVIGIALHDRAKAYPIAIMNWPGLRVWWRMKSPARRSWCDTTVKFAVAASSWKMAKKFPAPSPIGLRG